MLSPTAKRNTPSASIPNRKMEKMCYTEMKKKGSCKFKDRCRFSHDIPSNLQGCTDKVNGFIKNNSLCINEFKKQGSCTKKHLCRFSHNISEEQRLDVNLKLAMDKKYFRITQGHIKSKMTRESFLNNGNNGYP